MSLKLIVAGMHRSGTSLTASFVDSIGITMGDRLLAADANNRKGYFEDVDFLEFHRAALTASTRADEAGVQDWGWTLSESLSTESLANFAEQARQLIHSREETLSAWGWKDPRTTVILDFWHELLPDAKYLLVYRTPWDVAESMMRVGGDYFPANPDHSLQIWSFYNERLLDFYRAHRDQCILFNINAFIEAPEKLAQLIQDKLGIHVADQSAATRFRDLYSGDLFHALAPDHPVVQLCRHYSPRPLAVLAELEREADLAGTVLPVDTPGVDPERIAAWPFFCYRETVAARTEGKIRQEQIRAELEGELAKYRQYIADLNAEVAQVRADLYHQGLAALEEKHQLQKQVTDLYQLNQERETQTTGLLEEIRAVYQQLDEIKWENSQLEWKNSQLEWENSQLKWESSQLKGEISRLTWEISQRAYERDHLQLVIQSMEQTRIWRLREMVRKLAGGTRKEAGG